MSQRNSHSYSLFSVFNRYPLLTQGISWISGISVLSSGIVWAQTDPNPDNFLAPPIIKSQPIRETPEPTFVPKRNSITPKRDRHIRKRSRVAPLREANITRKQSVIAVESESNRTSLKKPVLSAPKLSLRVSEEFSHPKNNEAVNYAEISKKLDAVSLDNNAYIDSTDYNIGATRRYEPPTTVVLSERKTGCQKVLQNGQVLSGSICGNVARSRETIRRSRIMQPSVLTRKQSPVRLARVNSVQVGSIRVSGNSVRLNNRRPVITETRQQTNISNPLNYFFSAIQQLSRPSNSNTSFIYPLSVPASITSVFGWRIHPITGTRRFHAGTDIGAPTGTPVLAAATGEVAIADWMGGYGLAVVVQHNQSQRSLYGHLSEITVKPGEWVQQGTVIGRVGSTGNSTGPHLHFEWRQLTEQGWVATDPGVQLKVALGELLNALQTAQVNSKTQPGS